MYWGKLLVGWMEKREVVYKKDNLKDARNYRLVILLSVVGKIFEYLYVLYK